MVIVLLAPGWMENAMLPTAATGVTVGPPNRAVSRKPVPRRSNGISI
jgi:hypothetical protein